MNIADIKAANKAAGQHYFEASTMRFFRSQVERNVYEGRGGVYFITSEQFVSSDHVPARRKWTVRRFYPDTANIKTVGDFNVMDRDEAMSLARTLAKGEATMEAHY